MIRAIFKDTLPVMFGYIPLGVAFGVLFQELGYAWYLATLMAVFVFAGAAQFMIVSLLAAGVGLFEIVISIFLVNSRHMFYGLSLLKDYGAWGVRKFYLIFGLTDETYSLLTTMPVPKGLKRQQYYFIVTLLNHSYWVLGCTLGALIGTAFEFNSQGLEFTLTALFVVLVMEQWKKIKEIMPFAIAILAIFVALLISNEHMLLLSIFLSILLLLVQKSSERSK